MILRRIREFFLPHVRPVGALAIPHESGPGPTTGQHWACDPALCTVDVLGPTMVATVVERDLSGQRVADLSFQLRAVLSDPGNTSVRNLVVDLQNVEVLDSTCLGVLVELLQAVKALGGNIAVVSAAHRVEALFKLTRLDKVFPIRREVLSAIGLVEGRAAA
ncbi:MAG TPA: STAS domain-containing protein [Phycisphaerales bacterium]|nr:STAS domain-containing protein [Phycisphaerales bacterium]